eukprot:12213303-Prorocentrum_lima.AAC.1
MRRTGIPYTKPSPETPEPPPSEKYSAKLPTVRRKPPPRKRVAKEKPRISKGGFPDVLIPPAATCASWG